MDPMLAGELCDLCDLDDAETLSNSAATLTPSSSAISSAPLIAKRQKRYICPYENCGKTVATKRSLSQHIRTHTGERSFVCNYVGCNKAFARKEGLHRHIRMHTGEKPYICNYEGCGKAFALKQYLIAHTRTHSGEKPFECPYVDCSKAFAQKTGLDTHIRTHSGERPFKCPYADCNEAFTQKGILNNHILKHTKEKPCLCPYPNCGKAFATKCQLTTHVLIHKKVKSHKCTYANCKEAFTQRSSLVTHIRTHTGERPFRCDVQGCTEAFAQSNTLTRHIKRHHNASYVARKKQQEERVRQRIVKERWVEHFGDTLPPVGHFRREMRIDFTCADPGSTSKYCRIDFVLSTPGGLVFLEVDENQHRFGYGAELSCDMKRMNLVMMSLTLELGDAKPHIYWLRYNPNAWHVDDDTQRVPKEEREDRLMAHLQACNLTDPLQVGYAYYDSTMGELEVLQSEDYHWEWAAVTHNLGGLGAFVRAGTPDELED